MATGNTRCSEEISRRSVRIRLDAGQERPQMRPGFRHADIRAWTSLHRGEPIAAPLSLAGAWRAAGEREPSPAQVGLLVDAGGAETSVPYDCPGGSME